MSSPVLAFATLFLSLVVGEHPVEVRVTEAVARVDVELDGSRVATLRSPSWRAIVDFGDRLEPRRLEAIAHDEAGEELARALQWINLPTPSADVEVVLGRDDRGRAIASLNWANVTGNQPEAIRVSFDGSPVAVDDPERVPLPRHDPEQLHFLRVEVDFPDNVSAVEEMTFGGSYGEELNTELTAIPIRLDGARELPAAAELDGWFSIGGRPARVAAVDEGPAEIIIIRDRAVQPRLEKVAGKAGGSTRGGVNRSRFHGRFDGRLRKDQNLGFFWPFLVQNPSGRWTFPPTYGWMSPRDGGVGWFLTLVPPPETPPQGQMLADAVAVAGLNALTRNRRRTVVLILGDDPADESLLRPTQVLHYLGALRVPLAVWSPYPHPESPWGEVLDISTTTKLRKAVAEMSDAVDRQRIVWLEGRHLPQRIRLTAEASGVEIPDRDP